MPANASDSFTAVTLIATVTPFVTFVLGFFTARFTLTKKERIDVGQRLFENGKELMERQGERYYDFALAIKKYIDSESEPTLDDFFLISTLGEKYFYQQQIIAEAILGGKVDPQFRDNSLIPKLKETKEKSLPQYYATLQGIASKKGFSYTGALSRDNYESIFRAIEKYSRL